MFRTLLKVLLGVIAFLLVVAYLLPRSRHLERSIVIAAPQAAIFDRLNTFQGFNEYSPWFERDPNARYEWSGPARGVGARMAWESNVRQVGTGSQEIVVSEPYRHVVTRLDFGTGGRNDAGWLIEPQPNIETATDAAASNASALTKVTWSLDSDAGLNPVNRWFGMFLDRMVGPDYERGLAKLKVVAELAGARPAAAQAPIEMLDVAGMDIALLHTKADNTPDQGKIAAELGRAYGVIGSFLKANKLQMSGAPLAITQHMDAKQWTFDAAVPVSGTKEEMSRAGKAGGDVHLDKTYAGKALRATHVGPYSSLTETYGKMQAYMKEHGLSEAGAPWEQYISDPGTTAQDKLITYIYWPVSSAAAARSAPGR